METLSGPQDRPEPTLRVVGEAESPQSLGTDPESLPLLDPNTRVNLGTENEQQLVAEIDDFLERCDTGMRERIERWGTIEDAYNLVVDPQTTGPMPNAQRLVSEMLRVHCNITSARVKGSLLSTDPIMNFRAWFDQARDEDTQRAVEEAKATERFFHRYFFSVMRAKTWLPMAIHRTNKLGASVCKLSWEEKGHKKWFKGPGGKWRGVDRKHGKVRVDLIPNAQMKIWPLHGLSIRDCQVVGHDAYESPASFRALARQLKLEKDLTDQILANAKNRNMAGEEQQAIQRDAEGKDLNLTNLLSFKGEVPTTELWLQNYLLPGQSAPGNYLLFYYRPLRKLLWIGSNPYRCQRHPYFLLPHSLEDNCIWPSGVGHELMYAQKTDSALWNMMLDNLKVIGNSLRIIKSNSMVEAHQDELFPGGTVVTDDPEKDFRVEGLGGDLQNIVQVMVLNAQRGKLLTRVTNPEAGMADEVLKSGASPGSIAQLREGSGSHFKEVDENIRDALVDLCQMTMELIQQYGTADSFFELADEESAGLLVRMKYSPPSGDLEERFRITPKAPSATDNKEIMLQRLMLTFQMLGSYIPLMLQYAQTVMVQTDPGGAQRFQDKLMAFYNDDVLRALIENQEISGLGGKVPRIADEATPQEQQLDQAIQTIQALQAELQQLQGMQQGGFGAGAPAGAPMGPPALG